MLLRNDVDVIAICDIDGRCNTITLEMIANAASDFVPFRFGEQQGGKMVVSIYDTLGRIVMKKPMSDYNIELKMNVSSLNPGLYLVKVKNILGAEKTTKLIIKLMINIASG